MDEPTWRERLEGESVEKAPSREPTAFNPLEGSSCFGGLVVSPWKGPPGGNNMEGDPGVGRLMGTPWLGPLQGTLEKP
jgi:hypothetical protein